MRTKLICTAAISLLFACNAFNLGSRFVAELNALANQEATLTVTAADSADLAGAQLYIPPNALAADTKVTLEVASTAVAATPDHLAGPVAVWGPAGLAFNRDVIITVPFHLADGVTNDHLYLEVVDAEGNHRTIEREALSVDSVGGTVSFFSSKLVTVQAAAHGCNVEHACADGLHCTDSGTCEPNTVVTCGETTPCPDGQHCGSVTHHCEPNSTGCTATNACPDGTHCTNTGTCEHTVTTCSLEHPDTTPCPAGTVCTASGTADPATCREPVTSSGCSANAPCASGQVCQNGVCYHACETTANCDGGRICTDGHVCR